MYRPLLALALAACAPTVTTGDSPDGAAHDLRAPDLRGSDLRASVGDLAGAPPADLAVKPVADLSIGPDLVPYPTCSTQGPRDCTPGNGNGMDFCFDPPKAYWASQVNTAIEQVLNQHPEYFDFNQGFPCCPKAIQPDAYVDAVVANVIAQNLCSIRDPNDGHEIVVKLQNDCAENYNVLTSGDIVRHPPKYQGVCAPAWF